MTELKHGKQMAWVPPEEEIAYRRELEEKEKETMNEKKQIVAENLVLRDLVMSAYSPVARSEASKDNPRAWNKEAHSAWKRWWISRAKELRCGFDEPPKQRTDSDDVLTPLSISDAVQWEYAPLPKLSPSVAECVANILLAGEKEKPERVEYDTADPCDHQKDMERRVERLERIIERLGNLSGSESAREDG